MRKTTLTLSEIKLAGIKIRTNNANEKIPDKAKIEKTLKHYFGSHLPAKITGRLQPGTTYCVYTEYDKDAQGDYTYFVGEAVDTFDGLDASLSQLILPASPYQKFECGPGPMPSVCIEAWQQIWQLSQADLGGERSYRADFEVYDERASNPSNTSLDIYIGLKE